MRKAPGPLEKPCDIHDEVDDWLMTVANEGRKPLGRGVTGTRKKKSKSRNADCPQTDIPSAQNDPGTTKQNKPTKTTIQEKSRVDRNGCGMERQEGRSTGRPQKKMPRPWSNVP